MTIVFAIRAVEAAIALDVGCSGEPWVRDLRADQEAGGSCAVPRGLTADQAKALFG